MPERRRFAWEPCDYCDHPEGAHNEDGLCARCGCTNGHPSRAFGGDTPHAD